MSTLALSTSLYGRWGGRMVPSTARPSRTRRIDPEEKTTGRDIIPETAQEKPNEGEIIAVGPRRSDKSGRLTSLDVKVGDRVLFGKWSGTEVKIDGEELLIVK